MLVIDSLSTENKAGRTRKKSGTPIPHRSQPRRSRRIVSAALIAAAISTPLYADATPLSPNANANTDAVATVKRFVPPPAPVLPPRPAAFAPTQGVLTSLFGERWGDFHYGIDIAAPIGTPITAPTDGIVLEAGEASGFGLWVRVQQADGTIGVYGHIDQYFVAAGQQIKAGDVIAAVGNRGNSTGAHLHYEVWAADGTKTDPMAWLEGLGVFLGPLPV